MLFSIVSSTTPSLPTHRCVHEFDNVMSIWLNSMSEDEEETNSSSSKKSFSFRSFQSEKTRQRIAWNKRIEQSAGQRKMKWKLISFKMKRRREFMPVSTQDWMWLWRVLKISRFIESTRTVRETRGSERWGVEMGWKREKNSTGQKTPSPRIFILSSLRPFICRLIDGLIDWLTVFVWKLRDGSSGCTHTFVAWTEMSNCENFLYFPTMTAKLFSVLSRDFWTRVE